MELYIYRKGESDRLWRKGKRAFSWAGEIIAGHFRGRETAAVARAGGIFHAEDNIPKGEVTRDNG